MLNKSFDWKFSEEQFSTLVLIHKNANLARYLQKTVFRGLKPPLKEKQRTDIVGVLVCSLGHHSKSLSAIRPLSTRFAIFSLKSV